jgi:hypothetical protein
LIYYNNNMINIEIKTVPHKDQRYNTVGDYSFKDGKESILVSDMNNWKYETLVAIHEIIEEVLCRDRNIKDEDITNFDEEFDKNRPAGDFSEPGDDESAPYHKEHMFATEVEKMLAKKLNVDWDEYNNKIAEFYRSY